MRQEAKPCSRMHVADQCVSVSTHASDVTYTSSRLGTASSHVVTG